MRSTAGAHGGAPVYGGLGTPAYRLEPHRVASGCDGATDTGEMVRPCTGPHQVSRRAFGRGTIPAMTPSTRPERLPFTGDDEADRLLAADPLALLIGFALDQQVTVQKAFFGPLEIRRRTGSLDAATIAAMDPEALAEVFRQRPAIHRFPGSMAAKVQALCTAIARDYGNDAASVWTEAGDGKPLEKRLLGLPGIGPMKAKSILAVLGKQFGIKPPGWEAVAPTHPTLGDVDSAAALATYQAGKRAYKAAIRAGGTGDEAGSAAMGAEVRKRS